MLDLKTWTTKQARNVLCVFHLSPSSHYIFRWNEKSSLNLYIGNYQNLACNLMYHRHSVDSIALLIWLFLTGHVPCAKSQSAFLWKWELFDHTGWLGHRSVFSHCNWQLALPHVAVLVCQQGPFGGQCREVEQVAGISRGTDQMAQYERWRAEETDAHWRGRSRLAAPVWPLQGKGPVSHSLLIYSKFNLGKQIEWNPREKESIN